MRRPALSPALTLALLLPAFAAHADPAADFERLMAALPGLPLETDSQERAADVKEMVAGLTGRWLFYRQLRSVMTDDEFVFPDPEYLAEVCGMIKLGPHLMPSGEYGFTVTTEAVTTNVTHDLQWKGGSTFVSSVKGSDYLEYLYGKDYAERAWFDAEGHFYGNPWLGLIDVKQVSADLLLLQFQHGRTDLLIRCPEGSSP